MRLELLPPPLTLARSPPPAPPPALSLARALPLPLPLLPQSFFFLDVPVSDSICTCEASELSTCVRALSASAAGGAFLACRGCSCARIIGATPATRNNTIYIYSCRYSCVCVCERERERERERESVFIYIYTYIYIYIRTHTHTHLLTNTHKHIYI